MLVSRLKLQGPIVTSSKDIVGGNYGERERAFYGNLV